MRKFLRYQYAAIMLDNFWNKTNNCKCINEEVKKYYKRKLKRKLEGKTLTSFNFYEFLSFFTKNIYNWYKKLIY